jgi:hypothetical protein
MNSNEPLKFSHSVGLIHPEELVEEFKKNLSQFFLILNFRTKILLQQSSTMLSLIS